MLLPLTLALLQALPQPLSAEALLKAMRRDGVTVVLAAAVEDADAWETITDRIARGERAWLEVAERLLEIAADDEAQDLEAAVGEALARAPLRVLELADSGGEIGLAWVCAETPAFVEDPSYEERIETLARRERAVAAVKDPTLTKKRDACVRSLAKARAQVEKELREATRKLG